MVSPELRLDGLADGEDVADWIPRVVGDRVGDEARETVGGELQALVEAAVVVDLNSIVDARSESEAPRPVADAHVVEAPLPIPAGTQHGPDDSSGSEGRRYSLGHLRSSFPAALLRKKRDSSLISTSVRMVHPQRTSDEKRPGRGRQRINPKEFATTGPRTQETAANYLLHLGLRQDGGGDQ